MFSKITQQGTVVLVAVQTEQKDCPCLQSEARATLDLKGQIKVHKSSYVKYIAVVGLS